MKTNQSAGPQAVAPQEENRAMPTIEANRVMQFSLSVGNQAMQGMYGELLNSASSGRSVSMPAPVQAKMEHSFGTDFSSVKMLESPAVSAAGAQAFAQGSTVGFAPGKFSPNTQSGQELIGHELSHVVSQAKGEVSAPQGSGLPFVVDQGLEARADREGAQAARGERIAGGTVVSPMSISQAPIQGKPSWKPDKEAPAPAAATPAVVTAAAPVPTTAPQPEEGPTDVKKASQGEVMAQILSYDKKNIFNPDIQQMIVNEYIRYGNEAMKKTERDNPGLDAESLRILLFQNFRGNDPAIMNFNVMMNALAPNMGKSAMQRMNFSEGSAEQMAENTMTGMEDVGVSIQNNNRFSAIIGQTRKMFEGVNYFEKHPEAITELTTNNLFLRGIIPQMTATIKEVAPDQKENALNMSKFFQRIANDTVYSRNMGNEAAAMDKIKAVGRQPLDSIANAVQGMLNPTGGGALSDATWEAMRLAQAPRATPEERQTAYNLLTNEQFANMTPEQREACKAYIVDSRLINGVMRGTAVGDQKTQDQIVAINAAMKSAQTSMRTYRSIGDNGFATILQQLGLAEAKGADGIINRPYVAKNIGSTIGKVFSDAGYGSTTTEESFAIKWGKGLPRRDAPSAQAREYQKMIPREQIEATDFGEYIYNPSTPVPKRNQAIIFAAQQILSPEEYKAVQEKFSEDKISYHLLQINVPRNALVAFIDRTNANKDLEGVGSPMQQFEVLLHAGAKFKVIGAEPLYIDAGEEVPNGYRLILDMLEEKEAETE